MAGSLLAIGYGGVLHYFALEGGMRPILKEINRQHRPWARTGVRVWPVRSKLIAALPLINIITGLVAAALSGGGGGGASLGADVLIAELGDATAVVAATGGRGSGRRTRQQRSRQRGDE